MLLATTLYMSYIYGIVYLLVSRFGIADRGELSADGPVRGIPIRLCRESRLQCR